MDMDAIDALFLRLDEYQRNMFQMIDQKHRDLVDEINFKFDALNASQRRSDEMNRKTANSVNVVLRIVAGIFKLSAEQLSQILIESDAHLHNLSVSKNVDERVQIPAMFSIVNQVKSLLGELNGVVESWDNNNIGNISSEHSTSNIDCPQQMKIDASQQIKMYGKQQIKNEYVSSTRTAYQAVEYNKTIYLSNTESDTFYSGINYNAMKNVSVLNGSNASVTKDDRFSAVQKYNTTLPTFNRNLEENEKKRRFYKNKYNYRHQTTTLVSGPPDPKTDLSISKSGILNCFHNSESRLFLNKIDVNDPIDCKKV